MYIYVNNCHFTAQSFVILGKVEYTKFRMGLQAAKCFLTNSDEMEYFQKSMMNQIYEASFLLFVFVDPGLIFRNPNPSLFSVSNDHHCNEAYDWWSIADLWSIKCVLSVCQPPGGHHPSYWHLTLQSLQHSLLIHSAAPGSLQRQMVTLELSRYSPHRQLGMLLRPNL